MAKLGLLLELAGVLLFFWRDRLRSREGWPTTEADDRDLVERGLEVWLIPQWTGIVADYFNSIVYGSVIVGGLLQLGG